MRIVLDNRTVISNDIDQLDEVLNSHYTCDDTEQSEANVNTIRLASGGSLYVQVPLPAGWTRIGYLLIETDAPITVRLNTVDGTSGTEIPVSPIITPALSQTNVAPSPSVTASVQKGRWELRSGVNADGNSVSLTSVWLKNLGVTAAIVKVVMVGE